MYSIALAVRISPLSVPHRSQQRTGNHAPPLVLPHLPPCHSGADAVKRANRPPSLFQQSTPSPRAPHSASCMRLLSSLPLCQVCPYQAMPTRHLNPVQVPPCMATWRRPRWPSSTFTVRHLCSEASSVLEDAVRGTTIEASHVYGMSHSFAHHFLGTKDTKRHEMQGVRPWGRESERGAKQPSCPPLPRQERWCPNTQISLLERRYPRHKQQPLHRGKP